MSLEATLEANGSHAEAALWRVIRRELSGPLRVAVLAHDASVAQRLTSELDPAWEVIARDGSAGDLGLLDQLLGVHALVWATPAQAPLSSAERETLSALRTAPTHRFVVLADTHLLEAVSDDPTAELDEIRERLTRLLPAGWTLGMPPSPSPELRAHRVDEVARWLVDETTARLQQKLRAIDADADRVQGLLDADTTALDAARAEASRAAGHTLGSCRRHTEALGVRLRESLVELESDLPAQVRGVSDFDLARRAIPHWLQHVLDRQVEAELHRWRRDVLADLDALHISPAWRQPADLLHPPLHPPPLAMPRDWTSRLTLTAALGGAAVLALAGLWIPSALAIGGSMAWSTWVGGEPESASRDSLVQTARDALRALGEHMGRVFDEQLQAIAEALDAVQEAQAAATEASRAASRGALVEHLHALTHERDQVTAALARLRDMT